MAKQNAKGRKIGRNKRWCEVYASRRMRERNKLDRVARHQRSHPGDIQAKRFLGLV